MELQGDMEQILYLLNLFAHIEVEWWGFSMNKMVAVYDDRRDARGFSF